MRAITYLLIDYDAIFLRSRHYLRCSKLFLLRQPSLECYHECFEESVVGGLEVSTSIVRYKNIGSHGRILRRYAHYESVWVEIDDSGLEAVLALVGA